MASVLKWRRPTYPDIISFVLDDNEVIALSKKPLGVMCSYTGSNDPLIETEENKCEGYIQVHPREFLAAIHTLLSMYNIFY